MAKKGNRMIIGLKCDICGERGYVTERNKVNTTEKISDLNKFCKKCKKHTPHKEVQKLK